jgi:membrane-associated phospholipid phosphatase
VKVRPFHAPRILVATFAQGRTIVRGFRHLVRRHRWGGVAIILIVIILALFLFPRDGRLLAQLHSSPLAQRAEVQKLAGGFGYWGDYPTYNLPLAAALWCFGAWRKSRAWRRIAVICFLGATLGGLLDDCLRLTLGRPRPDAHLPDGFYGFPHALRAAYQSFPSGHAAAVCGTAAALLFTDLPLGLLTTVYALLVMWARMELYRHYPSDIIVGAIIGVAMGALIGLGARVRLPRCPPPPARPISADLPSMEKLQVVEK